MGAALETLIERTSSRGNITASTHIDLAFERGESTERLEPELESTIYRVVQESLNNCVKHAKKGKAAVSVTEKDGQVTIFVEDDGEGFSPSDDFGDRFGTSEQITRGRTGGR